MGMRAKKGDTVVCVNQGDWPLTHGREYKALLGTNDHYVRVVNDNGHEGNYDQDRFSLAHSIGSPIRTVTRRELVEWSDDVLSIVPDGKDRVFIGFKHPVETQFSSLSSDQLRSVLMVVSQIVEFLDEDKGDE